MNELVIRKIFEKIKREPGDVPAYTDLFQYLRSCEGEDFGLTHGYNRQLRDYLAYGISLKRNVSGLFGVYRQSLLFDAPHFLDSYLLYTEINREPASRFYQPRRPVLKRVVDALQRLTDDELDELFLSMPPRVGKLLADSTPVLTTEGWKFHGELKPGDKVFNAEGNAVKVLAVHPKHHTEYTVTFTDGESVKCHGNHEWVVYDRRFGKTRILETQSMYQNYDNSNLYGKERGHRYYFMLPLKEPLKGSHHDLPVPPYTFGAWLGDGTTTKPCITGDARDTAIISAIRDEGLVPLHTYVHKLTGVRTYDFAKPLRDKLHLVGLCKNLTPVEKYIPDIYLTADIPQRLELLAGLLDTDGCLRRRDGRYEYTTCDAKLRDGVKALVSTFGWRVSEKRVEPHTSSSGIVGKKPYWVLSFNPAMYIPCKLARKQLNDFKPRRRVAISKIEKSSPESGNCISVEGEVYLVGETLQPTHNSSLMAFYMSWLMGRDSEHPNLYSSYTDIITKAFYDAVLEILTDRDTYLWNEVFPGHKIVQTNAANEIINIDRRKHYPTLTCRSIDGTINGACDAQDGVIISDDLVSGIEEALSKDRLISKWSKVDNNLIPRGKGKTKYLWIGTRWSILDPAGIRLDILQNDAKYAGYRYEVINLPALNENDESNFDYPYGVGFDTLYYQRRRASFERNNDLASWEAQYMGMPIEREGTLFTSDDFRYYNGVLPEAAPDRVFMAVDPAYGGGDFVAAPVCFQYGEDIYIQDVVYDSGDKKITLPLLVNIIDKYDIQAVQVEATKATKGYKDELEERLKDIGIRTNLTTKPAPSNMSKHDRIFDKAPDIRERMIFVESGKRSKAYDLFMQNVFGYKVFGKNKHEDAPDSLSMAIDMTRQVNRTVEIFRRPF